ncbi:linear amide C-N hydrolase [Candidatus Entotheonella palauensis]|uniref:Choloylglycine hydrolase/NAAA C-terminal domain-containing protein n=1 Tax=Candidatus Entotheonella gemina TaxID=1429439 RepID=W4M6T4_9BACT|nr:linear amide C-N hydrolase [Candidatus Entotheonella palauensis]ETX05327.1 MAG: hypothetical protein ETSY2_23595 [Candidatus Entotheonella gemina]
MKKCLSAMILMLAGIVLFASSGHACSTFCLLHRDQPLFGRNYDWSIDDGLVIINKRQVAKRAAGRKDQPARWVSKYGSVTVNQYGRELPSEGVNEAGLVVANLWLTATEHATPDDRPSINMLQWVQYQLDTASSIDEVIASDKHLRVRPARGAKVHYFVCERSGTCASIEFLEGKLVAHTRNDMAVKALTNNTYAKSVGHLQQHQGFGGTTPPPTGSKSLDRFVRTASLVRQYDPQTHRSPIDYAFDILTNVAQGEYTKWSLVYDLHRQRIYFQTQANPQRRYIDLPSLDFACATPVQVLDINAAGSGDVTPQFRAYEESINRELIGKAYGKTPFLANMPAERLDGIARYPTAATQCKQGQRS